jgi:hypothetical protein
MPNTPLPLRKWPSLKPHQQASKFLAVGVYGTTLWLLFNLILVVKLVPAVMRGSWADVVRFFQDFQNRIDDFLLFVEFPPLLATALFAAALYKTVPPIPGHAQRHLVILSLIYALLLTPVISGLSLLIMLICVRQVFIRHALTAVSLGFIGYSALIWYTTTRWFIYAVYCRWLEFGREPPSRWR